MSEKIDKIVNFLKTQSEGKSATSIANAIGFSKSSSIMTELNGLVDEGRVIQETGPRFTVFKLAAKISKAQSKSVAESNEKTTVISSEKVPEVKLPELSQHELSGYAISTVKNKAGETKKKIVCPNGKTILLNSDEKIVVINDEPKYVVKTAQEIIACIQKYSSDKGLNVFTVNDIKQNRKISTDKDLVVEDNHIISLKIQKHNKAA